MKKSILLTLAMALGVASTAVADFNVPENTVYDNSSSPAPKQEWVKIPKTSAFDLKTTSTTAKDLGYRVYIQGNGPDGQGALRDTGSVDPAADDKQLGYLELWAPSLIKSSRNMYLVNDGTGQGFQTWEHALTLDFAVGKSLTLINCCPWNRDGLLTVKSGGLTFGYRNGVSGEHNHQNRKIVVTGQNSWLKIVNPSWVYIKELEMSDGAKLVGDGNMILHNGFKPAEATTAWTGTFEVRTDGGTGGSGEAFKLDLSGLTEAWTFPSSYAIHGITTRTFVVKPGAWATASGEDTKVISWATKPGANIEFAADSSSVPKGWSMESRTDGLYLVNTAQPPASAKRDVVNNKWLWFDASGAQLADDDPGIPASGSPTEKQVVYFESLAEYNALVALKGTFAAKAIQMKGGTWTINSDADMSGLDFEIVSVSKINLGNNARLKMTGKSWATGTNAGWLYPNNSDKAAVLELTVPEGETVTLKKGGMYFGGEAKDNQNLQFVKSGKGRLVVNDLELGPNVYPAVIVEEGELAKTGSKEKQCFGRQNVTIRVCKGARVDVGDRNYWDYHYEIAGNGPDGKCAFIASAVEPDWGFLDASTRNGCLSNLILTDDATVDATEGNPWPLSFWSNTDHYLYLNGHTLTVGMTEFVYWVNLRPRDQGGKVVLGKVEVYGKYLPWGKTEEEIGDKEGPYTDMSKVDVEVKTELVANTGCFFNPIKSLKFDPEASWRHQNWPEAGEYFETVVHETYRPSMKKMPQITLGAAGHLTPTLDLSTLTGTLDGTHLGFYAGSTVTVDIGQRDLSQSQKLVSWTTKPTNVNFKLTSKYGSYRVEARDDGLYAVTGIAIILQ